MMPVFFPTFLYTLFLLLLQEKARAVRELTATILARPPKMCNFVEWQDKKVVYKRFFLILDNNQINLFFVLIPMTTSYF